MNLRKQKFFIITLSGIALVSGCGIKTDMLKNNYTVNPSPLEVKGDSISINITANIPAKSFNPKANVKFTPYFKTEKGDIMLKSITIGGEKVTDAVDVKVNSQTGGKVTYTEVIPYNPDLERVTLLPQYELNIKGNYTEIPNTRGNIVLAEGTNTTALSVDPKAGSMVYDMTDYMSSTGNKMVNIYFPIDVAKFNAGFKIKGMFANKQQLDSLKKVLKVSKNWVVKGVSINAYASPDGGISYNDDLAKGRAKSTYNYMKKELKKLGFTEANDQNFKMGYTLSEDWAGYAKNVEASNHPDKAAVLAIINNKSINDDVREEKIRDEYPKFWNATKNTLLPSLRKSELVVSGATPLKTDDELKTYMSNLSALSDVELLHLGTVVMKNTADRVKIYTELTTRYSGDWRGFNDLGAVQLEQGKLSEGEANLSKANMLSPENPTVLLNLANLARINNDFAKAAELYKKAAGLGGDANYGMGIIAIKKGQYSEAVSYFTKSGKKDFNSALAQMLNGDVNGAVSTIDGMKPEDLTWKCYYLKAIAGARNNNQDMLTTNLTRAVELNADLRSKAKKDVEFIKFWNNPAFQTAIR